MEENTKLKQWMDAKGYSNRDLAERLHLSYNYIYKMAMGKGDSSKPILERFKFLFIEEFGLEEAAKVFEISEKFRAREVA